MEENLKTLHASSSKQFSNLNGKNERESESVPIENNVQTLHACCSKRLSGLNDENVRESESIVEENNVQRSNHKRLCLSPNLNENTRESGSVEENDVSTVEEEISITSEEEHVREIESDVYYESDDSFATSEEISNSVEGDEDVEQLGEHIRQDDEELTDEELHNRFEVEEVQQMEGVEETNNDTEESFDNREQERSEEDSENEDLENPVVEEQDSSSSDNDNRDSDESDDSNDIEGSSSNSDSEAEDIEDERAQRPMFQEIRGREGLLGPLRDNGQLSTMDHLLLELACAVRFNNPYEELITRLQILKRTYVNINIPTTKSALWKMLGRDDSNLKYSLYCEKCYKHIGNGKKVNVVCSCGACGPGKKETFVGTFVQVNIIPQIKEFLDSPNAAESLRYKERRVKIDINAIEDIYDGHEYKRLSEIGFLRNPNNFSLTLWTDGLRLAKSSKATCYPFLLQLNELSPHARKRHMFLAGIWVGKEKPNIGALMKPIMDNLNELYDIGIRWRPTAEQEIISKFIVVIFTADSVCKPMILRMKLYNGEFGCPLCFLIGKSINRRWIFNVVPANLRTMESMECDIRNVMRTGVESRGVLGCSPLITLRQFDLIKNQVVDIAHKDYLGNTKKFNEMYMTNFGKPWYIGKKENKKKIDDILTEIKTPSRISRKPRSLNTTKTWKASEWRNYLLYFMLPCLDDILPEPFFSHMAKYAEAIFILNSASITTEDLAKAKTYLDEFVSETETHYGEVNMRFNVHLNKHAATSTENWGPAWVFSTLPFESMNRPFAESANSPNHRAEQIVTRFFMKKFIIRTAEEEEISHTTRQIIDKLFERKTVQVLPGMAEGHFFVGKGRPMRTRRATPEEIRILSNAGARIGPHTRISFFRKATVHSTDYARKTERNYQYCDHIACSRDKKFVVIKEIISCEQNQETIAGFIGEQFEDLGGAYGTEYMRFVRTTRNRIFISYHDILAPGIIIEANRGSVAVHLSNCWETD